MADEPFLQYALFAVLEAADEGILVFDRTGTCRLVGRRIVELFGVQPAELAGKPRDLVVRRLGLACEEPEALMAGLAGVDGVLQVRVVPDIEVRAPRPRTLVWTHVPLVQAGTRWGAVAILRDVTRERAAERSMRQLETRLHDLTPYDALTRLPNFRRFKEELEREHGRSKRAWDSYAILRLDVDGMSAINAELGIPVGDRVLESVADRLVQMKREYDVLARNENDSFLVLLPGADVVAARVVADRLSRAVAEHDFELADRRKITIAVGGAVWVPPSSEASDDILRRATMALDEARERGASGVHVDAIGVSSGPRG